MEEPVLLHVITRKGKGYPPAEKNPTYFHGVGSFEIETGNCVSSKRRIPTYTEVFGDTMVECAQKDEEIVAITAAMPEGTGLTRFAELFPDRFFDVGIAEQHGVTFAAGMATEGYHPVVAIYSTFLQRAYDQILHDVCLEHLPVIFAIDRGGIVGEDGSTHQGGFDFSYLRSMPNMVVMAPKDENELRQIMNTAFEHNGPIAYRYPRGCGLGVPIESTIKQLLIGKGEILTEGSDVLILAIGITVYSALDAAKELSDHDISATVVNSRFVKPLDSELVLSLAQKIPNIVTVEDNMLQGGFGSAILECLNNAHLTGTRTIRLGLPDKFIEHGPQNVLRTKYGIDSVAIVNAARKLTQK
jgi:1-deoxy-D-xylulose-5-phosphate synthase